MTDMLKKSEKINTSDEYVKSDNLTEQWEKGELPDGGYYIKTDVGIMQAIATTTWKAQKMKIIKGYMPHGRISEVLAEVPSYEKWQASEKRSWLVPEFDNEIDELNDMIEELEKENAQMKKWCEEFNALDVAKENAQLKELLKECREVIYDHIVWIGTKGGKLCDKIDEVLK